jgi:hypothetical protein
MDRKEPHASAQPQPVEYARQRDPGARHALGWLIGHPVTVHQVLCGCIQAYAATENLPLWYQLRCYDDVAEWLSPISWVDLAISSLTRGRHVTVSLIAVALGLWIGMQIDKQIRAAYQRVNRAVRRYMGKSR